MRTIRLSRNHKKLEIHDELRSKLHIQSRVVSLHCLRKLSIVAHNVASIPALIFWNLDNLIEFRLELPKLETLPDVAFWRQKKLRRLVLVLPLVNMFGTKTFELNVELTMLKIWSRSTLFHCGMFTKLVRLEQFFLRTLNDRTVYLAMHDTIAFKWTRLRKIRLQTYHSLFFEVFHRVHYLNVANSQFYSHDFLVKFTDLTYLNLANNFLTLTSLNLSKKNQLKVLILRNNQIKMVCAKFLCHLQTVRYLDFYSCQLLTISTDVNFGRLCPRLQYLSFRANLLNDSQLTHDLFADCKSLAKLDLSNNNLTRISRTRNIENQQIFDSLTNLKHLLLSRNNLVALPSKCFEKLFNLTVLDLSSNRIRTLDSDWFNANGHRSLQILYLQNNEIGELPRKFVRRLPHLKTLNLRANQLTKLFKKNFDCNHELRHLNLSSNRIGSVYRKHFVRLKQLRFLNLQNNCITKLKANTICDLTYLRALNLSENQLKRGAVESLAFNRYLKVFVNDFDRKWFL